MNKFSVRWVDNKGNSYRKEYTNELKAREAVNWLRDNGADRVDLAVVVEKKEDKEESL